jgi:hypothetical protein
MERQTEIEKERGRERERDTDPIQVSPIGEDPPRFLSLSLSLSNLRSSV